MDTYISWFVFALAALAAELFSGTFYLLILAVGLAAGGLVALLSSIQSLQVAVAGLITLAGWALLFRNRRRLAHGKPHRMESLDLGAAVTVQEWQDAHHARVHYRGTDWQAELSGERGPDGCHYAIVGQNGNTLIISQQKD